MNQALGIRPNISWLTDTLATGGDFAYNPEWAILQADALVAMGITHVFDGRVEAEDAEVWAERGIRYVHFGVDDSGNALPAAYFDAAVELGREAQAAGGKILLHCHMGINRGPSAAVAVLMDRGMGPVEALRLITVKRPIAGVYYFMDAYDAHLARRGVKNDVELRAEIQRRWFELVRNPEKIRHITRSIDAHNREEMRQRREVWASLR